MKDLRIFINSDTEFELTNALLRKTATPLDETASIVGAIKSVSGAVIASGIAAEYLVGPPRRFVITVPSSSAGALINGQKVYLEVAMASAPADVLLRRRCVAVWYEGES